MRRLSKQESRQRWREARSLWNEFNPIGAPDMPEDEYEGYVGPCLRILEQGGPDEEMMAHLRFAFGHMGLQFNEPAAREFVERLKAWWQSHWQGTSV